MRKDRVKGGRLILQAEREVKILQIVRLCRFAQKVRSCSVRDTDELLRTFVVLRCVDVEEEIARAGKVGDVCKGNVSCLHPVEQRPRTMFSIPNRLIGGIKTRKTPVHAAQRLRVIIGLNGYDSVKVFLLIRS